MKTQKASHIKIGKFFHKHHTSIQIITNFCAILGVLVAAIQITSSKQIIQAIFQSQEKAASYKILAMRAELESNLKHINIVLADRDQYKSGHEVLQLQLSTAVYFSNPTYFKLEHLDKTGNDSLNENISSIYLDWEAANNLIQSSLTVASLASLNRSQSIATLKKNNFRILKILQDTQKQTQEVLQAFEAEPSPV